MSESSLLPLVDDLQTIRDSDTVLGVVQPGFGLSPLRESDRIIGCENLSAIAPPLPGRHLSATWSVILEMVSRDSHVTSVETSGAGCRAASEHVRAGGDARLAPAAVGARLSQVPHSSRSRSLMRRVSISRSLASYSSPPRLRGT